MTSVFKSFRAVALVSSAVGLSYIGYKTGVILNYWDPFSRPGAVSPNAHHVFLWESEAWFDCSVDKAQNVNFCNVWDGTGRLIASGGFRIEGENRAASAEELHPSTTGPTEADGRSRSIYLFGPDGRIEGKRLVLVLPFPKPASRL
jgi:hypothetical protein